MKGIDVTYLVYVDIYTNPEPVKVWARGEIYDNELELYSITNMEDVEMMECFNDWFIERVHDDVVQQAFEDNLIVEEYPDKQYGEL
jgi:hypothetical protein